MIAGSDGRGRDFLAALFERHREVAQALSSRQGRTVVDAMHGFEGLPSAGVAKAFPDTQFA
ncbi:hypothetical protein ASG87_15710 [Frateuria sp. Soil773]|nr:hypothetical protein ASG87_15710 [Frateuria sp. Soil773]